MDFLMTSIMKDARDNAGLQHTPLDLRWNNYTRHTCDRFIEQEDIRSEHDISCEQDDEDVAVNATELTPGSTSSSTSSDDSTATDYSADGVKVNKKIPFSIAAILSESGDIDSKRCDTPAQVFSPYSNGYLDYERYIASGHTKSVGHREDQNLSPIRGVSMLKTRYVYWCHACNCPLQEPRDAEQHQLVHRLQVSKCNLKRSVFNTHGYVTTHEYMDSDRIKCGLCNKVISECFFIKHQRLHDGHFCTVCGQEFSSNSRLIDHMNVHSGITPFECKICDRKFAKRSSLTQHQRYHRDHKSFSCQFCYKCFNSKYACVVHERLHTGENPFKCRYPGCSRAYPQKIQLKLHINSHHR